MIPIQPSDKEQICFKAPKDWKPEESGECADLYVVPHEVEGVRALGSLWQPNEAERAAIAAGHPVLLQVLGGGHPVVAVSVIDNDEKRVLAK